MWYIDKDNDIIEWQAGSCNKKKILIKKYTLTKGAISLMKKQIEVQFLPGDIFLLVKIVWFLDWLALISMFKITVMEPKLYSIMRILH